LLEKMLHKYKNSQLTPSIALLRKIDIKVDHPDLVLFITCFVSPNEHKPYDMTCYMHLLWALRKLKMVDERLHEHI
jgi:FPC/CPF motif-containing protein YcgG